MSIGKWYGGRRAVGRFLTAVVLIAQCGVVVAPLIDARDACNAGPLIAIGMTTPDTRQLGTDHGQAAAHNPATCPACIVQSLHARVERGNPLPLLAAAHRAVLHVAAVSRPASTRLSYRYSRAPPLLG
jgi:hypothetical protein